MNEVNVLKASSKLMYDDPDHTSRSFLARMETCMVNAKSELARRRLFRATIQMLDYFDQCC